MSRAIARDGTPYIIGCIAASITRYRALCAIDPTMQVDTVFHHRSKDIRRMEDAGSSGSDGGHPTANLFNAEVGCRLLLRRVGQMRI